LFPFFNVGLVLSKYTTIKLSLKPGSRIAGLIEKYLNGYTDKTEKLKNIKYLSIRLKSSF